jgi:hypothetical protein
VLTLALTNSLGQPDTNVIRIVQTDTNTPALANGQPVTIGLPSRLTPDTNGIVTVFRLLGNYTFYGPTLGAGVIYRFPDSSSNATAYPLSGFNTFQTVVIATNNASQFDTNGAANAVYSNNAAGYQTATQVAAARVLLATNAPDGNVSASLNQSTNIALAAALNATNGLPSRVWTLGTASAQNTNVFLGTNFAVTTLNGLTNKFSVDSTGKGTLTIGNTNSTFSNVVTNGAGLNYNLYVPAGLYDGSQNLGNLGAILTATGSGGVLWNNHVTATQPYSDSALLSIASSDYGDGGNGSVSIGNINAGGYTGNPNNGLVMNAQAGYTTISMDADTGDAQFSTIGVNSDITLSGTTHYGSGGENVTHDSYGLYLGSPNGIRFFTGTTAFQGFSESSGTSPGYQFFDFDGNSNGSGKAVWRNVHLSYVYQLALNGNGSSAFSGALSTGGNLEVTGTVHSTGNYTNDASLFVATKLGVGTTTPVATADIAGTMHSTGNYTNDATIFAATAVNEQAKDLAPHLTTSVATNGTVTASTSYWNETVYLSSGSTIASVTIALPSSGTLVGQIYRIHTKSIVTSLSVTGGSFADTAVVALTAGQTIAYQAQSTSGAYIRIQ